MDADSVRATAEGPPQTQQSSFPETVQQQPEKNAMGRTGACEVTMVLLAGAIDYQSPTAPEDFVRAWDEPTGIGKGSLYEEFVYGKRDLDRFFDACKGDSPKPDDVRAVTAVIKEAYNFPARDLSAEAAYRQIRNARVRISELLEMKPDLLARPPQ